LWFVRKTPVWLCFNPTDLLKYGRTFAELHQSSFGLTLREYTKSVVDVIFGPFFCFPLLMLGKFVQLRCCCSRYVNRGNDVELCLGDVFGDYAGLGQLIYENPSNDWGLIKLTNMYRCGCVFAVLSVGWLHSAAHASGCRRPCHGQSSATT
jgi:hypothetical protein